jgi:putative transposase
MSRKVKGSCNWKKAKQKVQKAHIRAANARQDFLHKLSRQIVDNHAMVVVEDLKIKNMTAKGKHKRGLNKSILDQGWGEFKRQLGYKLGWTGGLFVEVPAAYTSQTCSACGHVHKNNRMSQSDFTCMACGHHEHADINAAKNILARGHRVIACQGAVSQPVPQALVATPTKQQPAPQALAVASLQQESNEEHLENPAILAA